MQAYQIDILTYSISLLVIAGYHIYLRIRVKRDPSYTIQSVNNDARSAWVENIMAEKNGILAVQTLRNSTMAATFLASTAILLMMGTLNLMQNSGKPDSILHTFQSGFIAGDEFEQVKLLILLATFFWAFFSFSMAVRMYNHVGYIINSSNEKQRFYPTAHYVSRLLNRSGNYYSLGMRAYYLSVPMVFAMFNPLYMVVSSVILILALYHIDRAPDARPQETDIKKRERRNESRLRFSAPASEVTEEESMENEERKISNF